MLPGERCQLNCLPPFIDGGIPRFARCWAAASKFGRLKAVLQSSCGICCCSTGRGSDLSGCPGLNVNPFQELLFDELPRCIMACPDPPTLPEGYGREDLFGRILAKLRSSSTTEDFCALEAVSRNGDVMMAGLAKSTEPAYIFRTALSRRRWDGLGLHPNQSVGEIGQKGLPRCSAQSCKRSSR